MDKTGQEELKVTVRKRASTIFDGLAKSVSSFNERGNFDILPSHTNFVAVIKDHLRIVKSNDQELAMPIGRGIIYVKKGQVEIYLEV